MEDISSETGRSSEHSDSEPEINDGSRRSSIGSDWQNSKSNDSERQMNSPTETASATARRSNSSSSEESSDGDDRFQIDTSMFEFNFQTNVMMFNNGFQTDSTKFIASGTSNLAPIQAKSYVPSSENSTKSDQVEKKKPPVPRPTFQVCDVTNYQNGISLTTNPPVQVMDRTRGYDPTRIPALVFERNGTPLEWSVCSNDSLFSLNLGNHSLSRENANTFAELAMSEELSKSSEPSSFSRMPSIIMEETDSGRKSVNSENLQSDSASDETSKSLEERLKEDQIEEKDLLQTESSKSSKFIVSSLSHGSSATSTQSFTFPVCDSQTMRDIPYVECRKKRARSLCHCCNCSWESCCCSWPSCNTKCWTSCWKCSRTKGSGHASPILSEAERKCSVDDDIPHQQSHKKESEVTGKCRWRNCCNWFHCFSCSCSCSCCRWKPRCTTIRCRFCC